MKKTLAFLLAALMVFSSLVFTVSAEGETAQAPLSIIPVSDGTDARAKGDIWYGNTAKYMDDGSVGTVIDGIPTNLSAGYMLEMAFETTRPRDISGMTMLEFDLYLENAAAVVNASYQIELRSAGFKGDSNEVTLDGGSAYLKKLVDYELVDGWNHVEIPLSRFDIDADADFDPTQWVWFRIYNHAAGDATGKVSDHRLVIGSEGKTTTLKIDNMFFSNATATSETGNGELIIRRDSGKVDYISGNALGSGHGLQWAATVAETDITDYVTLNLDVYLSHEDAKERSFNIEMTSAGTSDAEEDNLGTSLKELAARAGMTLVKGWNRIEIPLATAAGSLKKEEFDFFRIFDNGTSGTEYADGVTRTVAFGRASLSGSRSKDTQVLIMNGSSATYGGGSSNTVEDVIGSDGALGTDGLAEWVWFNNPDAAYTVSYQNAWGNLVLNSRSMPKMTKLAGLQFDIWVSDAAFGDVVIYFEMTSSGGADQQEKSAGSTLNKLAGTTLEAGKWQTIFIPLSKLTRNEGSEMFVPENFNFIRSWAAEAKEFANGLVVATRNFYALNDAAVPTQDEDGNPLINMTSDLANANRQVVLTGVDGNPANKAVYLLNVAEGGVLANPSNVPNVSDVPLSRPIDASHADWMSFDLYLENLADWGDEISWLFGISSYGNCDHQQMTRSGMTINKMFSKYVVNEDGTAGELKDGWNHIEFPMYEMFDSVNNKKIMKTDDAKAIDWTASGPTQMNQIDYFRFYVQPIGNGATEPILATSKSFAAIDNIVFFDGGIVGTRDNVVTYGSADGCLTAISTQTEIAATAKRAVLSTWPMDITDKAYLQMDLYVNEAMLNGYTGSISLEISSNSLQCDHNEKQLAFTFADLGLTAADAGTWKTVKVALPTTGWGADVDKSAITRVEIYNGAAIPAGSVMKVDNLCFVRADSLETELASAQPALLEGIDMMIKANVNMSEYRGAAFELTLDGAAGKKALVLPAATTTTADGKAATCVATLNGIAAHRMTDALSIKVWAVDKSNQLTVVDALSNYSVQQYAKNMLTSNASDVKLVTLLSDMLTYGAAAQTYANNYNASNLATNVGEGLTLTPSTYTAPKALTEVLVGSATDDDYDAAFARAMLVLDGTVHIRYCFTANTTEGLTVTVGDKVYTTFNTDADGYYYVDVPVFANQFDTTYTAYFGTNTEYCVNYSVNHYIAKMHPTAGTKLAALLEALCNYGASASAYGAQ